MSEIIDTEALFQEIWNELNTSMSALENGGSVDMVSLDNKVRYFCQIVTSLPAQDAKIYQPKMEQIINHLTQLVYNLTEKKDALSNEIDMLDQRQRAQAAYANSRRYAENSGE